MSTHRINLFWLIIFTLTLPLAVVASTHLARRSFERVNLRGQTVTVKGYGELPITSDRAEWSASIVERNADLTQAYASLERHRNTLLTYLAQRGFAAETVELGPVRIHELYRRDEKGNRTNDIELYSISQSFAIASDKVQAVADTARNAGDLISEGVTLESSAPRYLYTKLDERKLEMLSLATQNARDRAERLTAGTGDTLGGLRSASQGVFQITPAFSTEVSGSGLNDTSSQDKVLKAVVTVEYAIND